MEIILVTFVTFLLIFRSLKLRGKLVLPPFELAVWFLISAIVGAAQSPAEISQGTPSPEFKSPTVQPDSEYTTGADLVEAVRQMVAGVRETSYQHHSQIDASNGIYRLDCSEFVSLILERIAPKHYLELSIEPGRPQPRAKMYFSFFDKLKLEPRTGWRPIIKLAGVVPGDIVAWQKIGAGGRGDTGHVMIVAESAHRNQDGTFRVRVYDSSEIPHADDSRPAGSSGVGSGSVLFRVNENGAPIAFQFNPRLHWHSEPIAIARLEPM
jgi:hypothetical protein